MSETHSTTDAASGTSPGIPVVQNGPALVYQRKAQEYTKQATELGERSRLLSNLRGLSFGVVVISAIGCFTSDAAAWRWVLFGSSVAFAILVAAHARVIRREELSLRRLQVNASALKRISGAFRELPEDGSEFRNPLHPCADDLDLFGKASVFQLVNRAHTRFGQRKLSSFLMNRCPPEELVERQAAVQELAELFDLRQELEALALPTAVPLAEQVSTKPRANHKAQKVIDPEPLLAWAESEPKLLKKPALSVLTKVLPVITCAYLAWAMYQGWHALTWIAPLFVQGVLLATAQAYTGAVFAAVSSHQGAFLRYGPMLALLEQTEAKSRLLVNLKRVAETNGMPPSVRMRQFERIVGWFELRHNGLVYPIINLVLMWDFHCVFALERWQQNAGKQVRAWFNTLGELEALSSFAGFAYDNPSYAWPKIVTRTCFEATELGHPLILKGRVTNDIKIEQGGRALLVTGSNMSGKSTLMRAIGVNAMLAQAGAPVCARELTMGTVSVRTSMRISDSLEQGVSHFYAELHKLKAVLDARNGDVPVLFLLDEVLHGTNSRERQVGARWVLAELLRANAIGAVSTHDSGLCTLPEPLMSSVRQVHLREITEGAEMTFDYKLRPGPVQSGNALRLMRSLGIGVPLQDDTAVESA